MATLISSQRYINDSIVAEKIDDRDFEIMVSPVFVIDGVEYQVLLDGHHSLAAAIECNSEPVVIIADSSDHDAINLITDVEQFLDAVHMGDDYYNVITGADIW